MTDFNQIREKLLNIINNDEKFDNFIKECSETFLFPRSIFQDLQWLVTAKRYNEPEFLIIGIVEDILEQTKSHSVFTREMRRIVESV